MIVSRTAAQRIVSRPAVQHIVPTQAGKDIVSAVTVEPVGLALRAGKRVVALRSALGIGKLQYPGCIELRPVAEGEIVDAVHRVAHPVAQRHAVGRCHVHDQVAARWDSGQAPFGDARSKIQLIKVRVVPLSIAEIRLVDDQVLAIAKVEEVLVTRCPAIPIKRVVARSPMEVRDETVVGID